MSEYIWAPYQAHEGGIAGTFKFAQNYPRRVLGFLKKGGRQHPGWYVHQYRMAGPAAKLPHTLTEDEAKDAAKMILLSLKETA